MMHGHGKSDSFVVLRKPTNEAGPEAKKSVEGRELARGICLSITGSGLSRSSMPSALERIRHARINDESELV